MFSRASKGDATPAGEKFSEILRQLTSIGCRIINIKSVD